MASTLESELRARTHDISRISYHIQDVETFGDIVNKAAAGAFPNKRRSRYRNVYVLLLSWEADELGVISEVQELDDVFTQTYRFQTEQWRIPNGNSHNALAFRLMDFLRNHASNDHLLAVYYGGHGSMNDDRQCIWSCTETVDSPTIQWYGLQTMLEQCESDALILLDCCAAGSSATTSGNGVTELIAACGFERWAPGVGEHSFSRSLIEELKYLSHGTAFSVALLHNKVLSRIKYWKPRYTSVYASERRKTPVYIQLANESNRRSIEIMPLPHAELQSGLIVPPQASSGSSGHTSTSEDIDMLDSDTSQSSLAEVWPDPAFNSPKVLISIALEDDQRLRPGDWNEWLRNIPAFTKYMHVQGIYKSDSMVMIGLLPIAIWDLLPKHPAISFVCFSRSKNLMETPLNPSSSSATASDKEAEDIVNEIDRSQTKTSPPESGAPAAGSMLEERISKFEKMLKERISTLEKMLEETRKAVRFQDAVGRIFSFPIHLCRTWTGMEQLIRKAFLHEKTVGPLVAEGAYDLLGPKGETILPHAWETTIQPGWVITMHMRDRKDSDTGFSRPPVSEAMRPLSPSSSQPHTPDALLLLATNFRHQSLLSRLFAHWKHQRTQRSPRGSPPQRPKSTMSAADNIPFISNEGSSSAYTESLASTPSPSGILPRQFSSIPTDLSVLGLNAVSDIDPVLTPAPVKTSKRAQKHPASFQCSLCPKRFTRAYNLRSHLRTHTDERPFVCPVCGKAFARQHDRKRHEGLHTGEKKFVCRGELRGGGAWGCGRRFARADALGRHVRSEAGSKCIQPLVDEEEATEPGHLASRSRPTHQSGRGGQVALPAALMAQYPALLAQYPALRGLQSDRSPEPTLAGEGELSRPSSHGAGEGQLSRHRSLGASSGSGGWYSYHDDEGFEDGESAAEDRYNPKVSRDLYEKVNRDLYESMR